MEQPIHESVSKVLLSNSSTFCYLLCSVYSMIFLWRYSSGLKPNKGFWNDLSSNFHSKFHKYRKKIIDKCFQAHLQANFGTTSRFSLPLSVRMPQKFCESAVPKLSHKKILWHIVRDLKGRSLQVQEEAHESTWYNGNNRNALKTLQTKLQLC